MNYCCFLVVLFCCVVWANSECLRAPAGELPDGCDIGNLFVKEYPFGYRNIINNVSCNSTIHQQSLIFAPKVQFLEDTSSSSNQTYLLTAVDRTDQILMWMVSNLTVQDDNVIYLPFGTNPSEIQEIQTYKGWFQLEYTTVEFLIFEEHRQNSSASYNIDNSKFSSEFNLSAWIDSQQDSGITICGPIAGGSVVAHNPNNIDLSSVFTLPKWNISDIDIPKIPEFTEPKPQRSFFGWIRIYYRFICFGLFLVSVFLAVQKKGCRRGMAETCCGCGSDEEDEVNLSATSNPPQSSTVDPIPMRDKCDNPSSSVNSVTSNPCNSSFVYSIPMEENCNENPLKVADNAQNSATPDFCQPPHVDSVPRSCPSYRPNSSYY